MIRSFTRKYNFWSFGINIERLPDGYLFVFQFWKTNYMLVWGMWPDEETMGWALYMGGKFTKYTRGKLEDYY